MISFDVHFQPIYFSHDLITESKQPMGYEALLRPQGGIHPLKAIEESKVWHEREALELQIFEKALNIMHYGSFTVFANLTPEAFVDGNFQVKTERIAKNKGIAPARVCIEISEKTADPKLEEISQRWIGRGFYVALDDFGTGNANLESLLKTSVDYVKLDRCLLSGIDHNSTKQSVVRELIRILGHSKAYPILEGVEATGELNWILAQNWDVGIQGYALSLPLSTVFPYVT